MLTITSTLIACSSTPSPRVISAGGSSSAQAGNRLEALQQLTELKEEVKKLRNAVEESQFDTRNMQNRQRDLYNDLNRRMSEIEHNQVAITGVPSQTDPNQIGASSGSIAVVAEPGSSYGNSTAVVTSGGADDDAATQTVSIAEQQAYDAAFDLLKKSRYSDAINAFEQMADSWPQGQLADDAWYWKSEALYVNRDFEQALKGFRHVVSQYPNSQRVPEALLKTGYIQYDIGSYQEAASTFQDIVTRFPGHQVTVSAQTRLRRIQSITQ